MFVNDTNFLEPIPINVVANMKISVDIIVITVSWQVCM